MNKGNKLLQKHRTEYLKDSISVFLICHFKDKNSIGAVWKLIYTTILIVSFIFTSAVLIKDLTGFDKVENVCKKYWAILFIAGIVVSIFINRQKRKIKETMKDGNTQVEIQVDDVFCIKGSSYVIPTNTFFRTIMDDEYISPNSVQGLFQIKYFKDNLPELDSLIETNLEEQGIIGEISSDKYGCVKKYPIGTTAKVNYNGKHYYFVAI